MKFGKRYSNMTVFMAMLHGILIGVAAVAVIGFLLIGPKGKDNVDPGGKEVPASGPAPVETTAPADEKPVRLIAKQHGVFSSAEGAAAFIAEDPSLVKAAIIQADNQFFVWTAVGLNEQEIEVSEFEGTFRKPFSVETSACSTIGAGKLRDVLVAKELAEIKNLTNAGSEAKEDDKGKGFSKNISTIMAFTSDLRVVRLHLLSHYSHSEKCVKINF